MAQVSLNLHALKAANKAASTEETRYYLRGVYVVVEPNTITYVATNGHILFAYQETVAGEPTAEYLQGAWIIPSATIAQLKVKKFNHRSGFERADLILNITGDMSLCYDEHAFVFTPVDGTYLDWRRVIPNETDSTQPALNYSPEYLLALKKAGEIMGNSGNYDLHYNGNGPAMITYSSVEYALGVIMPYRANTGDIKCPAWVRPDYSKAA